MHSVKVKVEKEKFIKMPEGLTYWIAISNQVTKETTFSPMQSSESKTHTFKLPIKV